jgi:hypothetical protein
MSFNRDDYEWDEESEKEYWDDYYNNIDFNNPFELLVKGIISHDDFKGWIERERIEKERKDAIIAKRRKIADIIFNL